MLLAWTLEDIWVLGWVPRTLGRHLILLALTILEVAKITQVFFLFLFSQDRKLLLGYLLSLTADVLLRLALEKFSSLMVKNFLTSQIILIRLQWNRTYLWYLLKLLVSTTFSYLILQGLTTWGKGHIAVVLYDIWPHLITTIILRF